MHMAGSSKNLFFLYAAIALLYLIHVGVDLPIYFDDWLRNNPNVVYLLIGVLYLLISSEYLDDFEESRKDKKETKLKFIKYGLFLLVGYIGVGLLFQKGGGHKHSLK